MNTKYKKTKNQKLRPFGPSSLRAAGFTLLFASLIGSLVIAVGLAILDITIKQLALASAGRESQQAFYSADTGTECALYLDRGAGFTDCRLGFFGAPSTTSSGSGMTICGQDSGVPNIPHIAPGSNDIQCLGKKITITRTLRGDSVENIFELQKPYTLVGSSDNEDMCFSVAVLKTIDTSGNAVASGTTIIESRGYNTCNVDAVNRFERAIRTVNQ